MNDADNINEQQIIERLRDGSYEAFNMIYDMYSRRLYAFCMLYCKNEERSKDIVQDVFLKLWNRRNMLKTDSITLYSLLFVIAKNILINAYRCQINSKEYGEYVRYTSEVSENSALKELVYEDFHKKLHKAMEDLPKTQREVIMLSKVEGMKNKEIAEKLSLSEQTVKNQLSLGLKQLKGTIGFVKFTALIFLLVN